MHIKNVKANEIARCGGLNIFLGVLIELLVKCVISLVGWKNIRGQMEIVERDHYSMFNKIRVVCRHEDIYFLLISSELRVQCAIVIYGFSFFYFIFIVIIWFSETMCTIVLWKGKQFV